MCINRGFNELQLNIVLKWIKCMRDDGNSKEKTLASMRYFICQIWGFNYLVMSFGILND